MTLITLITIAFLFGTLAFSVKTALQTLDRGRSRALWSVGALAVLQISTHIVGADGFRVAGLADTADAGVVLAAALLALVVKTLSKRSTAVPEEEQQDLYDRLTGLPNRKRFVHLLDRTIGREQRVESFSFALLMVDLD
ncbi:MAG: diguanylate cyclase, partial [Gemmatimonadota bacterium]|nr:diguanylate cyclase [Gemmatimonadota bacterium]